MAASPTSTGGRRSIPGARWPRTGASTTPCWRFSLARRLSATLVIHPGALGDVLLGVPALRALRAARPHDALVLAAQPRLGALLAALGLVDAHMSVERLGLERLFVDDGEPPLEALRGAPPVVCWFAARDPVFVRRLREAVPGAVVASPIGDGARPVWEHLLATVGSAQGPWRDPLAVPAPLAGSGHVALRAAGWDGTTPLVLVHAGAGGLGKRWPVDGFARALRAVSARRRLALALVQGPADADATAALAARLPDAAVLPEMSLGVLAGALGHAGAWLGNDSGIGHLAAAIGVPALVLFKAANLAWRSWSASARTVTVDPGALRDEDVSAAVTGLEALLGGERGP